MIIYNWEDNQDTMKFMSTLISERTLLGRYISHDIEQKGKWSVVVINE